MLSQPVSIDFARWLAVIKQCELWRTGHGWGPRPRRVTLTTAWGGMQTSIRKRANQGTVIQGEYYNKFSMLALSRLLLMAASSFKFPSLNAVM